MASSKRAHRRRHRVLLELNPRQVRLARSHLYRERGWRYDQRAGEWVVRVTPGAN